MLVLKGYNVILVEKYRIKRDVNQMINQALEVEYFTGISHCWKLLETIALSGCEPID